MPLLITIVKPYMVPSMLYKLGLKKVCFAPMCRLIILRITVKNFFFILKKQKSLLCILVVTFSDRIDEQFGIKYVESKPKSDSRKRSVSEDVSLKFRLDQRSYDKPTSSSMLPFMEKLALFMSCTVKTYINNTGSFIKLKHYQFALAFLKKKNYKRF